MIKTEIEGVQFTSKPYLYAITGLGIAIYGLASIFILYAVSLALIPQFRFRFFHLIIASIIAATILIFLARKIILNFGNEEIFIGKDYFIFHSKMGRTRTIYASEILYIKIKRVNPVIEFLPLSAPVIQIFTHNKIYNIKSIKYLNSSELIEFFENQEIGFNDDFAMYFHRSQNNISMFITRFTQDSGGVIGLTIIMVFTFLALWGGFAMLITGGTNPTQPQILFLRNPDYLNYLYPGYSYQQVVLAPPSKLFWFGTDFAGRDLFSRLIYGTSYTFLIAFVGGILSIFFIIFFGFLSAFNEGPIDNLIMRISDSLLSFPPFIFLLLFSAISIPLRAAIPGGFFLAVYTGLAFVTWPTGARLIRSEIKSLLETEYILASKQLGANDITILIKHVIPQIIPSILILFTFQVTDIIIGTTFLGYIGFGSESTLTWGSDLSHALNGVQGFTEWWTIVFPTLFIFLLVFGLTVFSDSIRDNMDPRLIGGEKSLPYEVRKKIDEGIY